MAVDEDAVWPEGRPNGEPSDDEFVTGKQLIDTEVLVTTLCRFSGLPVGHSDPCPLREDLQHPDVECRSLFFQAEALRTGSINLEGFDEMPEEVRQPWMGGTPIATGHR